MCLGKYRNNIKNIKETIKSQVGVFLARREELHIVGGHEGFWG